MLADDVLGRATICSRSTRSYAQHFLSDTCCVGKNRWNLRFPSCVLMGCVLVSQGPKTAAADSAIARGAVGPSRRRGRENVKEFLAKKREIFLVQMGLDTKQLEINKLEERAMRR